MTEYQNCGSEQSDHPQLSILIPCYNGQVLLERYLPLLLEELSRLLIKTEVVIADDASTDNSASWLQSLDIKIPLKIMVNKRNLGFSGNANAGMVGCQSDLVLLLNTDMEVLTGSIEPLLRCAASNDDLFAVVPQIELAALRGRDFEFTRGRLYRGWISILRDYPPLREPTGSKPEMVLYACGGAMMVNRNKFLALGGFDSLYAPFYFEDVDLSYRAWKMGWRILRCPDSTMTHHDSQTIGSFFSKNKIKGAQSRNQWLFMWRNLSDPKAIVEHVLWLPLRLLKSLLFSPIELLGFVQALRRLPMVLERRSREKKHWQRGDREVMAQWERK
ncbi:MAG: glycosyltransferase family 2 protein [Planctomycetes bacterium]|nr:glycosyltransferase family 2 protein [Planctomycetota bacterium]